MGRRVIYTSLDPSTAIIEVGVPKGLDTLDVVPHTLLEIAISDPAQVHVVDLAAIPNLQWLQPGVVSAAQQAFGDVLLATHPLVVLPSVVSSHSWNLLIDVTSAVKLFKLVRSAHFVLDPRLNPTSTPRRTKS